MLGLELELEDFGMAGQAARALPTRLVTFDVTNTLIRASMSVGEAYLQTVTKLRCGSRPPTGIKAADVDRAFGMSFSIQHQRSPCYGAQVSPNNYVHGDGSTFEPFNAC